MTTPVDHGFAPPLATRATRAAAAFEPPADHAHRIDKETRVDASQADRLDDDASRLHTGEDEPA